MKIRIFVDEKLIKFAWPNSYCLSLIEKYILAVAAHSGSGSIHPCVYPQGGRCYHAKL